jgi:hypothetical protein
MAGTVRHQLVFIRQTLMTAGLAMTIALVLLSAVRKLDSNCPIPQTEIQTKDRRFDRLP